MKMKMIFVFLAMAVLLSGCTGPTTTPAPTVQPTITQQAQTPEASPTQTVAGTTAQTMAAQQVAVEITNFAFVPGTVTIQKGTTVVWTQKDSAPHTITGTGFDSGSLSQGQTFSRTFNEAGTFNYVCSIHASMKGTIIVQ